MGDWLAVVATFALDRHQSGKIAAGLEAQPLPGPDAARLVLGERGLELEAAAALELEQRQARAHEVARLHAATDYDAVARDLGVSEHDVTVDDARVKRIVHRVVSDLFKTIEEFDWDAQPAVRQQIASLASGGFLTEARNVVLLGPPGTKKLASSTSTASR